MPLRPVFLAAALAGFAVALAGCGQRGPLYLRDSPPPGVKPARPEPYRPVPYPAPPQGEAQDQTEDAKKR
jgi:predicted small lipoprotein YifL